MDLLSNIFNGLHKGVGLNFLVHKNQVNFDFSVSIQLIYEDIRQLFFQSF